MKECRECDFDKKDYEDVKVRLAVVESKVKKIEENIEQILTITNWLVRTIIGGFITAIIAFLVRGGV